MNLRKRLGFLSGLLSTLLLSASCGHKDGDGHSHGKGHDHDHGHEEAPPAGATFQSGKGILLAAETRMSLGVEIAEVVQRPLPYQLRFPAQIFGEKHDHLPEVANHAGCDVHGSGFVAAESAALVKPRLPVELIKGTNEPLHGVVLAVQKSPALGEAEIVVGVSNAIEVLAPGEFVPARISLPRTEAVRTIPVSALLRSAEGSFAYVVRGEAYLRTAVGTGTESDGWVEITEGLEVGEKVVAKPVQTLWLIELRATKGGGHSH